MHYGGICINMISMKTCPEQGIARSPLWCCGFCTASSLVLLESIQQKQRCCICKEKQNAYKKERTPRVGIALRTRLAIPIESVVSKRCTTVNSSDLEDAADL